MSRRAVGKGHATATRFLNHRTDNDLVATLGTCYQSDFRFFTMLQQEAWDFLRWETMGNAVHGAPHLVPLAV